MAKIFEITAAVNQFHKQLSSAQRGSSLFSEAPVIAGKVLRRGSKVVLNEAQYLAQKTKINMLVKAGSLKVHVVGEDGKVEVESVSIDPTKAVTTPEVELSVDLPKEDLIAPGVVEDVISLAHEVVSDVVEAVKSDVEAKVESAPAVEAPTKKKGKKGKSEE